MYCTEASVVLSAISSAAPLGARQLFPASACVNGTWTSFMVPLPAHKHSDLWVGLWRFFSNLLELLFLLGKQ